MWERAMKRKIRSLYVLLFLLIVLVIPVDAKEYSNVNLDSSLIDQEIITEPETLMESETIWVDDTEEQTKNTERFTEETEKTEKTESTTETVNTENGISDFEKEQMVTNMEQMGISGEISFEVLYDEYNKPGYILSTGDSSYAIARREDLKVIERSKSSPSPYNDYFDLKKYYGGALCYYVWMNDKYYDIRTDEYCDQISYVISPNNSHAEEVEWENNNDNIEEEAKLNALSEKSKKVYPGKAYIAQADQYIRRPAFGNNQLGTCSAVACGIALNYLDKTKLSGIIPAGLSPRQQMGSYDAIYNPTGDNVHKFIVNNCNMPVASHGSMLSAGIDRYRNKFDITRNARLSLKVVDNIKYDVYYVVVQENITNDMPVIVTTMLGGGDHHLHSMVAYGYSVEPSDMGGSSFFVKLHEGWYGNRYMEPYTEGGKELYQTREYELFIGEISYLYEFSLEEPMSKEAPVINSFKKEGGMYQFGWKPVKKADSYDIYRSSEPTGSYDKIVNVSGDSYTYSDVPEIAGNYYYKIKAIRNCYDNYKVESYFSDFIFAIPMRLDIQDDRVTIRIDKVSGDIKYELIRQDMTGGEDVTLNIGNNSQFPFYSCVDTSVIPGHTYKYRARGYRTKENRKIYTPWSSWDGPAFIKGKVSITSVSPMLGKDYVMEIRWSKLETASNYDIYRGNSSQNLELICAGISGAYFIDNRSLVPDTKYYYMIQANCSNYSVQSTCVSGKTGKRLPAPIITVKVMPNKSITINWSQISGYDGMYKLYRRENDERFPVVISESTNLSYTDTNIEPGSTYSYQIAVQNEFGTTFSSVATCSTGIEAPQFVNIKPISSPPGYAAEISWAKSNGAKNYRVHCSYYINKSFYGCSTLLSNTELTYIDRYLPGDTIIFYKVEAIDKNGNSKFSNIYSYQTPKAILQTPRVSYALNSVNSNYLVITNLDAFKTYCYYLIEKENSIIIKQTYMPSDIYNTTNINRNEYIVYSQLEINTYGSSKMTDPYWF